MKTSLKIKLNKKLIFGGALMLLLVSAAYATDQTTGSNTVTALFASWKKTLLNALVFIEFVSGFGGVILVVMGLFQLRSGHGGQGGGQQVQTKSGFIYMILGGSLLVVGTIAGVLGHSVNSGVSASANVDKTLSGFSFKDSNN
ncbi:hypothetical protein [Piscirickettsia litoralis]|uniref:Uncharacterized protein n=1 Tax=Piscirickettsia litoralis TaxID=1891921 RepID=A0ABX3A4R9_9GAMM|nr:hypothetical protein [Piscirickettsia litoralis]ODN43861.1 hypothetical protein BGC07_14400 [Piscirickettsia litoralis]